MDEPKPLTIDVTPVVIKAKPEVKGEEVQDALHDQDD